MSKLISLTRGHSAIVDDDDFGYLSQWNWYASSDHSREHTHYAIRKIYWNLNGRKHSRTILMHRELIGVSGMHVDHINGNGLDNRRANLRIATEFQNQSNRKGWSKTGFKGVYANRGGFLATIVSGRTKKHLGVFLTAEDAARAYDVAARTQFGEFAKLNFPNQ